MGICATSTEPRHDPPERITSDPLTSQDGIAGYQTAGDRSAPMLQCNPTNCWRKPFLVDKGHPRRFLPKPRIRRFRSTLDSDRYHSCLSVVPIPESGKPRNWRNL